MIVDFIKKFFTSKNHLNKPSSDSIFYALDAEVNFKKDDYKNALKYINIAIASKPDYDLYYYTRAKIFFKSKNIESAIRDMKKAIEINPEYKEYKKLLLEYENERK